MSEMNGREVAEIMRTWVGITKKQDEWAHIMRGLTLEEVEALLSYFDALEDVVGTVEERLSGETRDLKNLRRSMDKLKELG